MTFTSLTFIVFAILLTVAYYTVPKKAQWIALLCGSVVFYLFASFKYFVFLLFTAITTWGFSLVLGRCNSVKRKKLTAAVCIICNVGVLAFLKYINFFIDSLNGIFSFDLQNFSLVFIPLGISFYTFQSLGYMIDVYRQTVTAQGNFFKYFLYVSFFPQISQGPIGRYSELAPQLYTEHRFDCENTVFGFIRILIGFFKKLVIADRIALFVNGIYSDVESFSGTVLFIATMMFAIQLYADFSGYMDIALGISRCLNITLAENFKTPYFSRSVSEFWRRWHITLGAWFRDYLYYPLMRSNAVSGLYKGLSKQGHKKAAKTLTTVIGLALTWITIGIWHGASLNFLAYGCFNGFFVILAAVLGRFYKNTSKKLHINEKSRLWSAFQIIRTFIITVLGFVLFRSANMGEAFFIYSKIFSFSKPSFSQLLTGWDIYDFGVAVLLVLALFFYDLYETKGNTVCQKISGFKPAFRGTVILLIIFAIIIFGCYGPDFQNSGFVYEMF